MVERQLPKLNVAGSNPVARSQSPLPRSFRRSSPDTRLGLTRQPGRAFCRARVATLVRPTLGRDAPDIYRHGLTLQRMAFRDSVPRVISERRRSACQVVAAPAGGVIDARTDASLGAGLGRDNGWAGASGDQASLLVSLPAPSRDIATGDGLPRERPRGSVSYASAHQHQVTAAC